MLFRSLVGSSVSRAAFKASSFAFSTLYVSSLLAKLALASSRAASASNGFVVVGDVGKREDFYATIGKYGAQFVGFFGVIGGEENFHYAYFPNEASWASMSSLQPFSA